MPAAPRGAAGDRRGEFFRVGGWKDPATVLKCYERPSEDAQRAALDTRKVLHA